MKIAILSTFNAGNIKTWSGIPFSIISQLKKNNEVDIIEPFFKRTFLSLIRGVWYNKIRKKKYFSIYDISVLKANSKKVQNQIGEGYDLIISFQFYLLPFIKGRKILITDATFDNLKDYYFDASDVSDFCLQQADTLFSKCISDNYLTVFSSDWARNNAIEKYNGNAEKLFTIPFGANLTYIPTVDEVSKLVDRKVGATTCKLLFLGAFWERKGGIDALDFIDHLISLGLDCKLIVVGCNPEIPDNLKDKVEVVGFLNKENDEENIRLQQLLETSHALLLPSLAECAACVYAEANAYGLPAIGRDTGGVSTIIKDETNGLLLSFGTSNFRLAQRWRDIFLDKEQYKGMCLRSKNEYETRLNYEIFHKDFVKAIGVF